MVKCTGRGLVVKRPGVLSKVQMLDLMKEIPESEIQVKFFVDAGEERGEIFVKNIADFRP